MKLSRHFYALYLMTVIAFVSLKVHAVAGEPDTSFDDDGYAFPTQGSAKAVAVQADGKIVIAGEYYDDVTNTDMFVARVNPDGTNDITFSGDGVQRIDFGIGSDWAWDMVVQPDGKIVLGGYARSLSDHDDFALVRLNTDGSIDTSFSGGKVTTDFAGSKDTAFAIALQPDGKILQGGTAYTGSRDFALTRYHSDGTLDNSFGVNGKVTTDINGTDRAYAVVVQPDGKILLGGQEFTNNYFALVRYNADGTLDDTFGTNGIVTTDFGGTSRIWSLVVQPDGKILAGGENTVSRTKYFAIARYNSNGSLDIGFTSDGKVTYNVNPSQVDFVGRDIYLQPDGKILMVGTDDTGIGSFGTVIRLNTNGSIDSTFDYYSFGRLGVGFYDYGLPDSTRKTAHAIAMQPDGSIVLAGSADLTVTTSIVTRLVNDATLGFLAPHGFQFTDATEAPQSAVITSDQITVSGLRANLLAEANTVPVRVGGGEYAVNAGGYTTEIGYATAGNQISVRHTSAASTGSDTDTLLTIGGLHAPNNLALVLGNTTSDTFTSTTAAAANDSDNDGMGDDTDNCTLAANSAQRDTDGDDYGNYCDPDFDNNGTIDFADLAYLKSRFFTSDIDADLDGDGTVDFADLAVLKSMFFGPPGPSGLVP